MCTNSCAKNNPEVYSYKNYSNNLNISNGFSSWGGRMERPHVNDPKTKQILDEMEAGKISPTDAKLRIPDHEKAIVIDYILCWEDETFCEE